MNGDSNNTRRRSPSSPASTLNLTYGSPTTTTNNNNNNTLHPQQAPKAASPPQSPPIDLQSRRSFDSTNRDVPPTQTPPPAAAVDTTPAPPTSANPKKPLWSSAAQGRLFSQLVEVTLGPKQQQQQQAQPQQQPLPPQQQPPQQQDAVVRRCFPPEEVLEPPRSVSIFCFPDVDLLCDGVHLTTSAPQTWSEEDENPKKSRFYTIMLTDDTGQRHYGFVRRFYIPNSDCPVCLCYISLFPWFDLFRELLIHSEQRYLQSWDSVILLASSVLEHPLPNPGGSMTINLPPCGALATYHVFFRPDDDNTLGENFFLLVKTLGPKRTTLLFSALLMERRVAFLGSDLERLSHCIHAAASALYPFKWQHIFIPVVPYKLLEYLDAPLPFLMGFLHGHIKPSHSRALNETVVVDTDSGEVSHVQLSDQGLLPRENIEELQRTFFDASNGTCKSQAISAAFRSFFRKVLGDYHKFVTAPTETRNAQTFDLNNFLHSRDPILRPFLQAFCASQMFEQFISSNRRSALEKKSSMSSGSLSTPSKESPPPSAAFMTATTPPRQQRAPSPPTITMTRLASMPTAITKSRSSQHLLVDLLSVPVTSAPSLTFTTSMQGGSGGGGAFTAASTASRLRAKQQQPQQRQRRQQQQQREFR
ncbi:Suppression of tumorigenicity 5 protein [Pelomyxa schiedti]|nr:Suppression of tumorigenicity 5 protein [Pelomyxa schiedti]